MTWPPKRSVSSPRGMRNREPRITGVAMTTLIWVFDSRYCSWNWGASGATSPHTEKHRAKLNVASTRALYAPGCGPAAAFVLIENPSLRLSAGEQLKHGPTLVGVCRIQLDEV